MKLINLKQVAKEPHGQPNRFGNTINWYLVEVTGFFKEGSYHDRKASSVISDKILACEDDEMTVTEGEVATIKKAIEASGLAAVFTKQLEASIVEDKVEEK